MKFNIQEDNGILKYATEEEVKEALDINGVGIPTLGQIIDNGPDSNVVTKNWSVKRQLDSSDPNVSGETSISQKPYSLDFRVKQQLNSPFNINTTSASFDLGGFSIATSKQGENNSEQRITNLGDGLPGDGIKITDEITKIGLKYTHLDVEDIGKTVDGWIPHWKAVTDYVDSNSGGATSLQEVTTGAGNNTTTNKIVLIGGTSGARNKDIILKDDPIILTIAQGNSVPTDNLINLSNGNYLGTFPINRGTAGLFLKTGNNQILFRDTSVSFDSPVSGHEGVNPSNFVTKSQLDAKPSGATSLQELTTGAGNNVTDNITYFTGENNLNTTVQGIGISKSQLFFRTGGSKGGLNISSIDGMALFKVGNGISSMGLGEQTSTIAGSSFSTRVSGSDAINPNEFVTKAQLDNSVSPIILSEGSIVDKRSINVTATNSIFMGADAGSNSTTSLNSNFFGRYAGQLSEGSRDSNFFGESAGRVSKESGYSNFFGTQAGYGVSGSTGSNFFGRLSGYMADTASNSNFFGNFAGREAKKAASSNFIGNSAGHSAVGASGSNFIGVHAGNGAIGASGCIFIGTRAGAAFASNNVGSGNIIIGNMISLPNGYENSMNIGGVIYGTGIYNSNTGEPSTTPSASGKIGIGVIPSVSKLEVAGDIELKDIGNGFILRSPNNNRYKITVSDSGSLLVTQQQ